MNLAFLLHIYQPPIQEGRQVREIAESCYIPLIKAIKNNSTIGITLNIPLSVLYQLHTNGYDSVIKSIRELYDEERIEITTSGAYHPLLTKLPSRLREQELVLNEYGLGYYLGKDKGFEGEDALLLKNISGVFPPEMAINEEVVNHLNDLGYEWVAVDEVAIPEHDLAGGSVFSKDGLDIKIVARNTNLSNLLSFKRDTRVDDFVNEVLRLRQEGSDAFVALDGEYFGHHYEDGIYVFNSLMDKLTALGVNVVKVSTLINQADSKTISSVNESSWGASHQDMHSGNIYPMWLNKENEIQTILWDVFNKTASSGFEMPFTKNNEKDSEIVMETFPIWDEAMLDKLTDLSLKNDLLRSILLLQSLNSDQFWWASGITVGGEVMYDKVLVNKSLELYQKYALVSENKELIDFINEASAKIKALL